MLNKTGTVWNAADDVWCALIAGYGRCAVAPVAPVPPVAADEELAARASSSPKPSCADSSDESPLAWRRWSRLDGADEARPACGGGGGEPVRSVPNRPSICGPLNAGCNWLGIIWLLAVLLANAFAAKQVTCQPVGSEAQSQCDPLASGLTNERTSFDDGHASAWPVADSADTPMALCDPTTLG